MIVTAYLRVISERESKEETRNSPPTNTNTRNKVRNHRRAIDRFLVSSASDHKSLVRDIFSATEATQDTATAVKISRVLLSRVQTNSFIDAFEIV